jgi:hypothetical protein
MIQTIYTCRENQKMTPVETVPGIRGRRMKESSGGGEFKYDMFD